MHSLKRLAVTALLVAGTLLALTVGAQSPAGAKEVEEFKQFDVSGNGYLSGNEVLACLCGRYDTDGDSRITFLEFAKGRGVSWAGSAAPAATPSRRKPVAATPVAVAAVAPVAAVGQGGYKVGDMVEARSYGKWYKAQILAVEGSGYRVHYEGFSSASDEVVATDRIRRLGTIPPSSTLRAGSVALNGLYLRIARLQGGRQSSENYRFWPDGRVCKQLPSGGADAATFVSMQRQFADDCGRYAVQGQSITFDIPADGKYTVNFRQFDGTNFEMNFMPTVKVRAYPPGARLSGLYEGLHFPSPLRADRYVFRPDGTFNFDDRAMGAEDSGPPTSVSGTYQLGGNTLVLTSQAGTKRYTIYQLDEKGTLVLESTTLTRK